MADVNLRPFRRPATFFDKMHANANKRECKRNREFPSVEKIRVLFLQTRKSDNIRRQRIANSLKSEVYIFDMHYLYAVTS